MSRVKSSSADHYFTKDELKEFVGKIRKAKEKNVMDELFKGLCSKSVRSEVRPRSRREEFFSLISHLASRHVQFLEAASGITPEETTPLIKYLKVEAKRVGSKEAWKSFKDQAKGEHDAREAAKIPVPKPRPPTPSAPVVAPQPPARPIPAPSPTQFPPRPAPPKKTTSSSSLGAPGPKRKFTGVSAHLKGSSEKEGAAEESLRRPSPVPAVKKTLKVSNVKLPTDKPRLDAIKYLESELKNVDYLPEGFVPYLESRIHHFKPEVGDEYVHRVTRAALLLGGNILGGRIVGREAGKEAVMAEGGVDTIARGEGGDGLWGRYAPLND